MIKAIVAMTPNRVIGCNGKIPWYLPEDFKWFKKQTSSNALVMGRSTFESIGKPLPNRFTYVLTNNVDKLSLSECETHMFITYRDFLREIAANSWATYNIWVCGGASVYKQLLPLCDEVYATIVLEEYEGDTYMPEFESNFNDSQIITENREFWIVKYFNPKWKL